MQAISGTPYTLTFGFKQDNEYVVPDEGSVVYTLYDNAGAAVAGQTAQAVTTDAATNQIQISISGTYNTIAGGKDFEQRSVRVKYKINGKDFSQEDWYYVTLALNFRVRMQDVITLLGIKEGEILFDEIDLVQAYFKVANTLGADVIGAALSAGNITQIKVNEAIKITAALDLSTVLELKAFRKFGNELNYSRFDKIDFATIRASLQNALTDALSVAAGTPVTPSSLFLVTQPVNPMTG